MSATAWLAVVVGSGLVVGSIVWLIVSPDALATAFLQAAWDRQTVPHRWLFAVR
jgi:hypothetical protein